MVLRVFLALCLSSAVYSSSLAVFTPCPTRSASPVTITSQYQAVSTCNPTVQCYDTASSCTTIFDWSTYSWVSTVIPTLSNGIQGSLTVTAVQQPVTFSSLHSTSTRLASPSQKPRSASDQATIYDVLDLQFVAAFHELGPLAIANYPGSGICDVCDSEETGALQQNVSVRKCLNQECIQTHEVWEQGPSGVVKTIVDGQTIGYSASRVLSRAPTTTTRAQGAPTCRSYVLQAYRVNTNYLRASLGYLAISDGDAYLKPSRSDSTEFSFMDGQMKDSSQFLGTASVAFGILETHKDVPRGDSEWTIEEDGQVTYKSAKFTFNGGSAGFCVKKDGAVFGQYTIPGPKCKPIKLIARCAVSLPTTSPLTLLNNTASSSSAVASQNLPTKTITASRERVITTQTPVVSSKLDLRRRSSHDFDPGTMSDQELQDLWEREGDFLTNDDSGLAEIIEDLLTIADASQHINPRDEMQPLETAKVKRAGYFSSPFR